MLRDCEKLFEVAYIHASQYAMPAYPSDSEVLRFARRAPHGRSVACGNAQFLNQIQRLGASSDHFVVRGGGDAVARDPAAGFRGTSAGQTSTNLPSLVSRTCASRTRVRFPPPDGCEPGCIEAPAFAFPGRRVVPQDLVRRWMVIASPILVPLVSPERDGAPTGGG